MKINDLNPAEQVREEAQRDPEFRAEWDRHAFAEAVAVRVIGYRVEHHLTQTALARQLGMKQPAIARLESGDVTPSLDTLSRLASQLGITFHIDVTPEGIAV
jgi:DNA-binding XRE family transcriptional regulator